MTLAYYPVVTIQDLAENGAPNLKHSINCACSEGMEKIITSGNTWNVVVADIVDRRQSAGQNACTCLRDRIRRPSAAVDPW